MGINGKYITNKATTLIVIAIFVVINIIAQYFYFKIDLTEDKRYTLTDSTKELLQSLDDVIYADVLLDGAFPAGFKRLQNSTEEMLRSFKTYFPNLEYRFDDPNQGTAKERKSQMDILREKGIKGTRLSFKEGDQMVERYIFPYIILHYADRTAIVNLLEDQLDINPEVTLNKSVSLLEYKIAEGLQIVRTKEKKNILFTVGHGELEKPRISQLRSELAPFYNTGFINLDSTIQVHPDLDLLIVARPKTKFSDKHIFQIDQYIMNGGKVLWMIDKMDISLDSINRRLNYVPRIIETGLNDLWYRHGFRLEEDLVLDMEATKIPQVVGMAGGKPQTELFTWFYHPLAVVASKHPIVNDVDRVNMKFPSSISLIKTKTDIKKTVLLKSSNYSRLQLYPMQLNFEILRYTPDASKFNNGNKNLAVLLEGTFESIFKNRLPEDVRQDLKKINIPYRGESLPTKQLIVSDADFGKNLYSEASGKVYPIGYNKWEKKVYPGNKDFLLNAINFLASDNDMLSAKSKQVKLRLLDKVKVHKEQTKWQLINVLLPIIFVILFGLLFNWRRRKKYIIQN